MNLLRRGYAESRTKGPLLGATIAGLLNGLMPCPLTFAMAVKATSATTIMEGGLLNADFWRRHTAHHAVCQCGLWQNECPFLEA